MRNLYELDHYRLRDRRVLEQWGWAGDDTAGMFLLPSPIDLKSLVVIASAWDDWDHVSVSRATRCPNWPEMSYIAKQFFNDGEVAMQLHVPAGQHVSNHEFCLHWWRPWNAEIPLPPSIMVGIAVLGTLTPETARQAREALARRAAET